MAAATAAGRNQARPGVCGPGPVAREGRARWASGTADLKRTWPGQRLQRRAGWETTVPRGRERSVQEARTVEGLGRIRPRAAASQRNLVCELTRRRAALAKEKKAEVTHYRRPGVQGAGTGDQNQLPDFQVVTPTP